MSNVLSFRSGGNNPVERETHFSGNAEILPWRKQGQKRVNSHMSRVARTDGNYDTEALSERMTALTALLEIGNRRRRIFHKKTSPINKPFLPVLHAEREPYGETFFPAKYRLSSFSPAWVWVNAGELAEILSFDDEHLWCSFTNGEASIFNTTPGLVPAGEGFRTVFPGSARFSDAQGEFSKCFVPGGFAFQALNGAI